MKTKWKTCLMDIPNREKRGIERKAYFIMDLQCYKLFHCTVTSMDRC